MVKPLVEGSLFPLTAKNGFSFTTELRNTSRGQLFTTNDEKPVHFLQTSTKRIPRKENLSPVFAFDLQSLRVTYQSTQSLEIILKEKQDESLWADAKDYFNYENEQGAVGIIKVWINILLEDTRRNFLVLILSQDLNDYIYSSMMYELVESKLELLTHLYITENANKEIEIRVAEGPSEFSEEQDELISTLLATAYIEGLQSYWEIFNDLIMQQLKNVLLQDDGLETEQVFDDELIFKVNLTPLSEDETEEASVTKQNFEAVIEDSKGWLSQVRGLVSTSFLAITPEDRESENFDEDDKYYEEPDENITQAEVEYSQRSTGLQLRLGLTLHESDTDNNSSTLTIFFNGSEIQTVELDIENGLRIKDELDPDLKTFLTDNRVSLTGIIARMMQNVDRTLSIVSYDSSNFI